MPRERNSPKAAAKPARLLPRQATCLEIVSEIDRLTGRNTIDAVYRDKVISDRSRYYEIGSTGKKPEVQIIYTLLGFELKIGRRRLLCPDLATARYLSVFANIGCEKIAVPYDITRVSRIADELESIWRQMLLLVDQLTAGRSPRLRSIVMKSLKQGLNRKINEMGPGDKFPQFSPPKKRRLLR